MHEVQAPTLVGQRQNWGWSPCANGATAITPTPNRQLLFPVEPLGLLAVDHDALPPQQDMQATIAEPAPLLRQLTQLRSNLGIIIPLRPVAHALPISADHTTRPPLAHPQKCLETCDRLSLGSGRHQ